MLYYPEEDALQWVEGAPADGELTLGSVRGCVRGVVVAYDASGAPAQRPLTTRASVVWKRAPAPGDTVLVELAYASWGHIVRRPRLDDVAIHVDRVGTVPPHATEPLLRLCIAEHPALRHHYAVRDGDARICTAADGAVFESMADLLAHMIEYVDVDVLDELRYRPQERFANTVAQLQAMLLTDSTAEASA